jgi:NAD(P)-dependent dehydrogenase (short-subunit alcohol dehydrogenase family)
MDNGLAGKVVLVTGAGSGIGRATAELAAGMGAHVVASDLDWDRGAATVDALRHDGRDAVFVPADVTDGAAVEALVAAASGPHGRLDCAANCAGVGAGHAATHEYPEEEWDRIVTVNLKGTWLCLRAEIGRMLAQGTGGAIVNVASTLGLRGSPYASPYSASKHGVLGLTKTAALEYARLDIRVNAVCPGAIDTPMMDATFERFVGYRETLLRIVPMGRMGQPAEAAAVIAWLCSDGAAFVTGAALTVDGGLLAQ